jgi:hypothetical protein
VLETLRVCTCQLEFVAGQSSHRAGHLLASGALSRLLRGQLLHRSLHCGCKLTLVSRAAACLLILLPSFHTFPLCFGGPRFGVHC